MLGVLPALHLQTPKRLHLCPLSSWKESDVAAQNWLNEFLKRLKRLLGFSAAERSKIRILEEYHADGISVLQLEDPSIPGCIDLWRIDRHHERIKFFVCVLNTALLREDLALLRTSLGAIAATRAGGVADTLQFQLQEQTDILATHFWVCGWHKEFAKTDPKGRHYRSQRTVDVRIIAVDLQGGTGVFAGDRHALRFSRKVIVQLAANEFREYTHHNRNWQSAVRSINWVRWLEGLSKTYIDPDHVLQPRRKKIKGKKSG